MKKSHSVFGDDLESSFSCNSYYVKLFLNICNLNKISYLKFLFLQAMPIQFLKNSKF